MAGTVTAFQQRILQVKTTGTATAGACRINTDSGQLSMTAGTLPPMFDFELHLSEDGTIGVQSDLNGARSSDRVVRWENRFGSSRHWDLRLSYEERRAREVLAAISIYL